MMRLSSSLSLEKDTGANKEIIHYVSFDVYGKKSIICDNLFGTQEISFE